MYLKETARIKKFVLSNKKLRPIAISIRMLPREYQLKQYVKKHLTKEI